MLASFTTFADLSTSARIVAAKASGVELYGSTPSFLRASCTDGVAIAGVTVSLSLATISGGVPAGARMPSDHPMGYWLVARTVGLHMPE